MKVHLPHGAFLGNIDPFIKGLDFTESDRLFLTASPNWFWVHPMVLSMIAALALRLDKENIDCQKITAKSGHYLERMGLFGFFGS